MVVKMKHRVTISIDENLLLSVREAVRNKVFENKSQAFEKAMRCILDG